MADIFGRALQHTVAVIVASLGHAQMPERHREIYMRLICYPTDLGFTLPEAW